DAGGRLDGETLQLLDDGVVLRPAAADLAVGLFDGGLEEVEARVRGLGGVGWVLVPALPVGIHESLVGGRAIPRRVREVVVAVHAGQGAFRMVLADRL